MPRSFCVVLLALPAVLPACHSPQPAFANEPSVALGTEAPDWDAVFARTAGWTGADAVYSVDLGDGRTLWLFGDTWIGSVADGKHAPGSRLINNSIAVHRTPPVGSARPPAPDEIAFHWGPDDSDRKPTAWIVPDPSRVNSGDGAAEEGAGTGWYWPGDGVVVAKGSGRRAKLVLFLSRIGKRPGDHGVWGFKSVGGAVAVVDDPHRPARLWHVEQHDNPHVIDTDMAAGDSNLREISWGAAVFHEPTSGSPHGGYLYIYGIKEQGPWNKQLLLARVRADTVERFDAWRFYTSDGGWSADLSDAGAIADHVVNELSVERVTIRGRRMLIMVHSESLFGDRILLRLAENPQGPWSKPIGVYEVPGIRKNKTYFTYAAKGHAHLSRQGELLISYVINAHDFRAMVADASIYRPRFIRVPLDRLVLTGGPGESGP